MREVCIDMRKTSVPQHWYMLLAMIRCKPTEGNHARRPVLDSVHAINDADCCSNVFPLVNCSVDDVV